MSLFSQLAYMKKDKAHRKWFVWFTYTRIKCFFGLHYWTRDIMMTRKCLRCGKRKRM